MQGRRKRKAASEPINICNGETDENRESKQERPNAFLDPSTHFRPTVPLRIRLPPLELCLHCDTSKDNGHSGPLPSAHLMIEQKDAEQHGHHLPRHRDGHQGQRSIEREGEEDEELSDCAGQREEEDVAQHSGMRADEVQHGHECVVRNAERRSRCCRNEEGRRERGREQQGRGGDAGREEIHEEHHLRSLDRPVARKDLVLRRIDNAVQNEVDAEQAHA